jgi:hypothetical protein
VEEILAGTCAGTLSDGPTDVLSESNDDKLTTKDIVILRLTFQEK